MSVHYTVDGTTPIIASRKQLIQRQLNQLTRAGVIVDYDIQSNMPGLRWVLYGLPSYGTGRAFTTAEVKVFLEGVYAADAAQR